MDLLFWIGVSYVRKLVNRSVDHLLLHCEVTRALWYEVFNRSGMAWVMPKRVVDLFACWRGLRGNLQIGAVWNMIPLCLK